MNQEPSDENAQTSGEASPNPSKSNPEESREAAPDRIVLTGFMAAGKTTSGRLLAKTLGWRFVDVDVEIEAATGLSISEIFRKHGESYFRQLEHSTIRSLVEQPFVVLALGGGAIEDERTLQLLLRNPRIHLVYLEASFETILFRSGGTDAVRPVLADRENLRGRYLRRLPLYRQSHRTVVVDQMDPSQVVNSILDFGLEFAPNPNRDTNAIADPTRGPANPGRTSK